MGKTRLLGIPGWSCHLLDLQRNLEDQHRRKSCPRLPRTWPSTNKEAHQCKQQCCHQSTSHHIFVNPRKLTSSKQMASVNHCLWPTEPTKKLCASMLHKRCEPTYVAVLLSPLGYVYFPWACQVVKFLHYPRILMVHSYRSMFRINNLNLWNSFSSKETSKILGHFRSNNQSKLNHQANILQRMAT